MLGKQEHMVNGSCKFIHSPFRLRVDLKNNSCEILLPTPFAVLRDSQFPRNGKELFLRRRMRLLLRFIVLRPEWRTESTLINSGCHDTEQMYVASQLQRWLVDCQSSGHWANIKLQPGWTRTEKRRQEMKTSELRKVCGCVTQTATCYRLWTS